MNKIIKDKLNRSSYLTDVVREIQKTFNQQSKKTILSECKNEILTKGIPFIMNEYFSELDKILLVTTFRQPQYVILLDDSSHLCTYLCKYNEHKKNVMPIYHIGENKLSELEQPIPQLSFQHLANFRQTPNIVQLQGPKQKYGFGMGYAKKALDLAIRTDKVDEFVNQVKCFINNTKVELSKHQDNIVFMHIGDLLRVQYKGRQLNRYRSYGEPQKRKQDICKI
ncbi:hypothetical protein C1646_774889 [Rhizophagus diaphanus]|nr:hypothetical protein C1646_774889 [Rhizophagus diaphanus] [Rhizophagus sp. MUCL 43196]